MPVTKVVSQQTIQKRARLGSDMVSVEFEAACDSCGIDLGGRMLFTRAEWRRKKDGPWVCTECLAGRCGKESRA